MGLLKENTSAGRLSVIDSNAILSESSEDSMLRVSFSSFDWVASWSDSWGSSSPLTKERFWFSSFDEVFYAKFVNWERSVSS